MKLHLPKALLAAVLAVCVAQDARATITVDTNAHTAKDSDSAWEMTYDPATTTIYSATGTAEIKTGTKNDIILSKGDLFLQTWNGPADINLEGDLYMGSTLRVGMDHHNVNINNIYLIDSCRIYQYDDNKNRPYPVNITGTVTDKILSSNGSVVNTGSTLTLDNHTFNFSGKVDVSGLLTINEAKITLTGNTTISGSLGMRQGSSISFTDGEHNIQKFDIHNSNDARTETLTISGATVKITGSDGDITGTAATAAAVTIGHWNNGSANVIVGGNAEKASLFDVSGATIRMSWDSASALEIIKNGTVNAKGIQFANDNSDNAVVTLAGGRLNLGDGGVSANSNHNNGTKKRELNLNSGTLGALAETVNIAAGTTNIGGAVTIDTAIVNAEGEKTGKTANISFSNNVVLSDAAAFTIKGAGNVSINALAVKNTLKFDVQEATVLNVENVSLSLQDGAIALDTANVYTDNSEGTISAANGFAKSAYQLFDGYEWSGSETIDTYSVVTQGGDTFLLSDNSEVGTIYYVNKGTHTISTAGDYINGRALGYSVAENAGLVIDGASGDLSAADLLTGTTGKGNITVKTNISLSNGAKSKATGKLTVEGVSLSMGGAKGDIINLSSFSSVDLNGATLNYHGANTTFNNVTVDATGATISINDMYGEGGKCDVMTLAGTTKLNGALTIKSSQWKYTVSIEALTGNGNLDISSSADQNDFAVVNVGLAGYTGAITVTKNTGTATLNATSAGVVNLTGITLKNGATGTFAVSANANLGDVNIGTGSLSISHVGTSDATTTLKTLQGSGTLTLNSNPNNNGAKHTVTINAGKNYTGQLDLDGGADMSVYLNIAEGAKTRIKGDNDSTIAKLSFANNATLALDTEGGTINGVANSAYTYTLKAVEVADTATISIADSGDGWQAQVNIDSLTNEEGSSSGKLNLTSNTNTSQRAIVNLNGGTFNGEIALAGSDTKDTRKIALIINDDDVAKNAVITLNGNGSEVALAVGTDNVVVKGINDAESADGTMKIVSGAQGYSQGDSSGNAFASDSTTRTLEINTNGGSYSTSAVLGANLNLKKSGSGTQTFTGSMANFNGNVTVTGGELALTGVVDTLSLNQLSLFDTTNATGGTLSVGGANGGTVIVSAVDSVGSVIMGEGSVLNGNLTVGEGATLVLNSCGNAAATINGKLTLEQNALMDFSQELMSHIKALDAGDTLLLLWVDEFQIADTQYADLAVAAEAMVEATPLLESVVDAKAYFSSLNVENYKLLFENGALYIQYVNPIPEPTTATLSLLALAALASRRRRK